MLTAGEDAGSDGHDNKYYHVEYHHKTNIERFIKVVLDISEHDGDDGDEDEKCYTVHAGRYDGPCLERAGERYQHQPLHPTDHLHQHCEGEEECLVGCRQVDPCVEGDEEDLLDQECRVYDAECKASA